MLLPAYVLHESFLVDQEELNGAPISARYDMEDRSMSKEPTTTTLTRKQSAQRWKGCDVASYLLGSSKSCWGLQRR